MVFQISIHTRDGIHTSDGIVTFVTEAENPREALLKILERRPGLTDIENVYINKVAESVIL